MPLRSAFIPQMIYSISLETALLLVGVALLAGHFAAILFATTLQRHLVAFPRSEPLGILLFILASLYFAGLIAVTDLGEFSPMRLKFLTFTVIGSILTLRFVREFLAVRALGMLLLLLAEPLLESAWMRPEMGRLWLVGLVYIWIVAGLFCIGMPYLLRDAIGWLVASEKRWKAASFGGIAYGILLLGVRARIGA